MSQVFHAGAIPDFQLHDCSSVFRTDSGYEKWKQALVSRLQLVAFSVSVELGLGVMLRSWTLDAGRKNPDASWTASLDRLMVPAIFQKKVPESNTLDKIPGVMLHSGECVMCHNILQCLFGCFRFPEEEAK